MKYYHGVTQSHAHRSNELQASLDEGVGLVELAEVEEPAAVAVVGVAVVGGSMAGPVEGMEDMTAQKMLVRLELMK